jgi:hypothetical protein
MWLYQAAPTFQHQVRMCNDRACNTKVNCQTIIIPNQNLPLPLPAKLSFSISDLGQYLEQGETELEQPLLHTHKSLVG